ncbi:MAG: NUDIX hydrolase [Candidatus Limnocylindrales bacterium]
MARLRPAPPTRLRRGRATSAGGLVIRVVDGSRQIALGQRRRSRTDLTWVLPKGTVEAGETLEQTALREVAEETGLEVRALAPLGAIDYTFVREGTRIEKTVHFFLMEPLGGDLSRHDHEFEAVRWVPLADAPSLMSHETERTVIARAMPAIAQHWPLAVGAPGQPSA